jgi:PASTA domain
MPAWASGAWAAGAWRGTAWQEADPVEVPDVVGLTQAAATAALTLAGFVVAVVTASSSSVALGLVISQVPGGGSESTEGATVTITVSSGDTDPLDVKFSAKRPNVKMRRLSQILKKDDPLPAEITNMPDAPEPPAPTAGALARGLDLSVLPELAPVESPPVEVVQEAGSGLTPRNDGSTPSLDASEAPAPAPAAEPPAPAPQPGLTRADLEAETLRVTESVGKAIASVAEAVSGAVGSSLTGQMDGLVEVLRAVQAELVGVRADLAADRKAQALRERNAARAQEIASRLLKDE